MTTDFRALCAELYREFSSLYGDMSARIDFNDSYEKRADDLCDRASRALLDQPEPEGPTLAELDDLCEEHCFNCEDRESLECLLSVITDALARWGRPTPQPVPVSERLPGPGDLHPTDQWCWVCGQDCCAWHRVTHHFDAWSYWLPAHALPLPADD